MKNRFVFTVIVLLSIGISNMTYSQGTWVAEAGVNFANIKGDDIDEDTKTRTGLLLAAYYKYPLSNAPIILQPELMYSQKGLEFGSDSVLKLDYLMAAGLASYYFEVSDEITPFVKAGPYIGFNINAKQELDGNEADVDNVNDIDAGVIIRAGIQIERFEVGLRFARGLTDAFSDADGKIRYLVCLWELGLVKTNLGRVNSLKNFFHFLDSVKKSRIVSVSGIEVSVNHGLQCHGTTSRLCF